MEVQNLISLLQTGYANVLVRFKRSGGALSEKKYSYKCSSSMEPTVGDEFIVMSPRNGSAIVVVEEVNNYPDPRSTGSKWLLQKVDTSFEVEIEKNEKEVADTINRLAVNSARNKAMKELGEMFGNTEEDVATLSSLLRKLGNKLKV